MSPARSKSWPFGRMQAEPESPAADAADMGTAFGLDLSLAIPEAEPAAAPAPAEAAASGWVQRLTSRRNAVI